MRRKSSPASTPRLIHLLLILSLCLNVFLLVGPGREISAGGEQPVTLQMLREIKEPGIYGPSDMEIVEGSLTISTAGVRLQNTLVTGNLHLTEGIGDGSVELVNVTVGETALVQGGGEDTVIFENAAVNHLVIDREKGKVRVVLKGDTRIEKVTIKGAAVLSAEELAENGYINAVIIDTAAETALEGKFNTVTVSAKEARIMIAAGRVEIFRTAREAREVLLTLLEGGEIGTLEPGAPLELAGQGRVKEVKISAPGLFKFSGNIEQVTAGGRGIFLEFGAGVTEALTVEASEGTVMIHLAGEAVIRNMELNGAAGITGKGSLERVRVNAAGTTIEQTPGTITLAEGIKAEVAGRVMTGEREAEPSPAPTRPATPTVSLGTIGNQVVGPGQTRVLDLNVSPADARITVSSSNSGVASASVSGRRITISGQAAGTATITVRAERSGYNSASRNFTVTVDPVKEFKVADFIPGKKTVAVTLWYSDPQNYIVRVGNTVLNYYPDIQGFGGAVDEAEAKRSNVRVTRK